MRALAVAAEAEPLRVAGVIRCALAVTGVGLFFTNLDSYAAVAWSAPDPIRWVLAFAAAAAALALVDARRPAMLLRSPLLAWALLYFVVTTAWAIWTPPIPEVVQALRDRYRSILFLLTFALLFEDPRARRAGLFAVAIGVAFVALLNVAEFLSLVVLTDVPGRTAGRAAGFHINPNASGLSIALGLAVVTAALPTRWRAPLLLLGALGIAATFSRGASIGFGLVFLGLVVRGTLGPKYFVALLFGALVLFTYAAGYVERHQLLNENTTARVRLEHDDGGRRALAAKAWKMFADAPLAGNGLGSTETWDAPVQAHNVFLTLAADHGVLGLLVFPALGVALIARRRSAAGFAIPLMAAGFTSHGMLESRYSLLLIALAAAGSAALAPATTEPVEDGATS